MLGRPEDVEGECNAHLYLGDDAGDNMCTIRCERPEGHKGPHMETFTRNHWPVIITWSVDEKEDDS